MDKLRYFNDDELELLSYFTEERMRIFFRRHVEGQEEPWTGDEVLKDNHFCNIYRKLDRGTRGYLDNCVDEGYPPEEVLFNTVIYRIFNKRETFELNGFQTFDEWDPESFIETINQERENGLTAFSSAYMVTGAVGGKGSDKVEAYTNRVFDPLQEKIDEFFEPLAEEWPPGNFVDKLTEIPGISHFIAYEVYTDITYHEWSPYTENDYVNPGPGAKRGIQRLMTKDEVSPDKHKEIAYEKRIANLRDAAKEWFDPELWWDDKEPTLRTVEHTLCEFDKYCRAREEENVGLRNFDDPNGEKLFEGDNQTVPTQTGLSEF